ncbi:MAG: hypothetical protein AAGF12_01985 [Myxococcota bacterium]
MRFTYLLCLLFLGSFLAIGCGDDDGAADASNPDAQADGAADAAGDANVPDATPDARPDANAGCTEGCEFVEVVGGFAHSCARRANGEVRCWGSNVDRELGDGLARHPGANCMNAGDIEDVDCADPVTVSMLDDATQISSHGGPSTCALREGGSVVCWGLQSVSRAAGSDTLPRRERPEPLMGFDSISDISDGFNHTCGVGGTNALCIWRNDAGQLGNGDTLEQRSPQTVIGVTNVADVEVSNGEFSCAIDMAGAVFCWGSNRNFELGDGMTHETCTDSSTGTDFDCVFEAVPVTLENGETATSLALGRRHACALTNAQNVQCWGENAVGQLGLDDTMARPTPTTIASLSGITELVAGSRHTCVIDGTGQAWCWGDNEQDTVGVESGGQNCTSGGNTADCVLAPVQVTGLSDATALGAGSRHTCAIRMTGDIACWGWNDRRQLGDGTRMARATPVMVRQLE